MRHLARLFPRLKNLRSLDLSGNEFTTTSADRLARSIVFAKKLHTLDVSSNPLGYQGVTAIAACIEFLKRLRSLDVSCCGAHNEGAMQVLRKCRAWCSIQHLDISGTVL